VVDARGQGGKDSGCKWDEAVTAGGAGGRAALAWDALLLAALLTRSTQNSSQ